MRDLIPARAADTVGALRRTAWTRIESPGFSGEFKAVSIEEGGAEPRVRLQLLPEVGGKVLDMVVSPRRTVGYWLHLATSFEETRGPGEGGTRDLVAFISCSLLENAVPLTYDRVLGGRRTADGYELRVSPIMDGGRTRVEVLLAVDGTLLARRYTHRGVGWRETFHPAHRFQSRGFSWVLEDETVEEIAAPPEVLFELRIPEGIDR